MNDRVLFIGFEDCEYCQKAKNFLEVCGFDVEWLKSSRDRGKKLPEEYASWQGDYIFHMKSYYILPKSLLDGAKKGAISFHPSSPNYPGTGCLNWALYNNENKTGITAHYLNEKIDNGDIINVYDVPIYEGDNIESLLSRVHSKQLDAFYDIVGIIKKKGQKALKDLSNSNKNLNWGPKTGRIREIDQLQIINHDIEFKELEKIIRATAIGQFGPKLFIHGHEFRYHKKEQK